MVVITIWVLSFFFSSFCLNLKASNYSKFTEWLTNNHAYISPKIIAKEDSVSNRRIIAKENANVTIKNGNILSNTNYCLYAQGNAILNVNKDLNIEVEGIEYSNDNNEQYGIVVFNQATVNFEGNLNVKSSGKFACGISGNGSKKYTDTNTTVNILGGTITVKDGLAIYQPQKGKLNISAGTLEANTVLGIKSGEITISGGTLRATGTKVDVGAMSENIKLTGDAIFVELNDSYVGDVVVNYIEGKITSENANVLREYSGNGKNATINGLVNMMGNGNIRIYDFAQIL